MSNKPAATIMTASPKLDASEKKAPKRRDSSKRVSDNLKRSIAKELKSPKEGRRSRSNSPGPLSRNRSLSRKSSGKSVSKDKKEKKKKKVKKVESDPSMHRRSVNAPESDAPSPNASFPLTSSSTHSEPGGKKKVKRRRSSKASKKTMQDALAVAQFLENNKILGSSEHTQTTQTSDSASEKDTSGKGSTKGTPKLSRKSSKKPLQKSSSSKAKKEKQSSSIVEEEKSEKKSSTPPKTEPPRNRLLSLESIHGKSIHKTKTRRQRGNSEAGEKFIQTLEPPPPSPQQGHAILSSPPSASGRKQSVLKAKKEKQEQERRASLGKNTAASPSPRTTPKVLSHKKKEDYIHEVLDIVNSTHSPNKNSIDSSHRSCSSRNSNSNNGEFVEMDPDEVSSQSSCSVVSDGSYEKDDLLSHASEHSGERDNFQQLGSLLDENPSFGEHSFTIDADHELSPSKLSPTKVVLSQVSRSDGAFGGSTESFLSQDTLMEAMASSMSALHEVNEDESPHPSPVHPIKRSVPKKSALKMPAPAVTNNSGGRAAPLRLVPKRAKSDITSLSSGFSRMTKNLLEVKLPGRKTVTRQRSLTFNEKVRVKRVPCQAQICDGETEDLWFQPEEYEAIKRKTMALIRAVQDDQTGGVTYCTRGLERYFSVDAVQEKRNDAWDSVLDEQEAQRTNREAFNMDRISKVYAQTTRNSVKEAMERGKLDEDAIARYTKKMRQTLRRTYSNAV